jgi:predicted nucleotidyltransferase component of viral defense system
MKLEFFNRTADDQATIIREVAARRDISAVMVEKDFWVSWTLAVLFAHPEFREQLVFKGGTSLSKVFGVIERFSEDIDLSVNPDFVGIKEEWVEDAGSRNKRTERMKQLEAACIHKVRERFAPELERVAEESLGKPKNGTRWMEFQVDDDTRSPVVLFIIHLTKLPGTITFVAR